MSELIKLPVGRIVGGHPVRMNALIDDRTNQPKVNADGTPAMEVYVGYAIPKTPGIDWRQTGWGQQLVAIAHRDWPRGEHGAPTFAWKVINGDSAVPNKRGIAPNTREGYSGHWILNTSTRFPIRCFHAGRLSPEQQIQNDKEIKPGDYGRLALDVKGNGSTDSPGIYLNPVIFVLDRAGIEIVLSSGPSAQDVFGDEPTVQLPPGAQVDPNVQQQPAAGGTPPPVQTGAVQPAADFLNGPAGAAPPPPPPPAANATPPPPPPPEKQYNVNGNLFTAAQLLASGWSQAQIDALGQ